MKPEDSLPWLQEPAIGPYPESDESSPPSYILFFKSILILSSYLCVGLTSGLFSSGLIPKACTNFSFPHACYLSACDNYLVMIWRRVQITKPLIIQCLPAYCYFLVRSRHSSCTLYVRAFVINRLFWRGSELAIWKWLRFRQSTVRHKVLRLLNTAGCITALVLKKGLSHWPFCWGGGGGLIESSRSRGWV